MADRSYPLAAQVFADARGAQRMLRVRTHPEAGCVVLSLWRDDACVATFRLPQRDVPGLVTALTKGLAALVPAPACAAAATNRGHRPPPA